MRRPERLLIVTLLLAIIAVGTVRRMLSNHEVKEGHDLLRRGEVSSAIEKAQIASRYDPSFCRPCELLGEAAMKAGDITAARRYFREAAFRDMGEPLLRTRPRLDIVLSEGRYTEAARIIVEGGITITDLRRHFTLTPHQYFIMARAFMALGSADKALVMLEAGETPPQERPDAARIYAAAEKYDEALAILEGTAKDDPDADALRAIILEKTGRRREALEAWLGCSRSTKKFGGYPWFRTAALLAAEGRRNEALDALKECIRIEPTFLPAYEYLQRWESFDATATQALLNTKMPYIVSLYGIAEEKVRRNGFDGWKPTGFLPRFTEGFPSMFHVVIRWIRTGKTKGNDHWKVYRKRNVLVVRHGATAWTWHEANLLGNPDMYWDTPGEGPPARWEHNIYHRQYRQYPRSQSCRYVYRDTATGNLVAMLKNDGGKISSSLASRRFIAVEEQRPYFICTKVSSRGGRAYVGAVWYGPDRRGRIEYRYVLSDLRKQPEAAFRGGILLSPPGARYARVWLLNYSSNGTVTFDEVAFFPLAVP